MKRIQGRGRCMLALLVLGSLLTACGGEGVPSGGPYIWIDAPADGLTVPVDQHVQIEGHAAHSGGIARVEIWVGDELHHVVEDPPTRGDLVRFEQPWIPPGPGDYTVQVVAIGADGVTSAPDSVVLRVLAAVAEATATPPATPTQPTPTPSVPPESPTPPPATLTPTPLPPSPTPVPPSPIPPTPTPTPVPPTPTPTVPPPDTTPPPVPLPQVPQDELVIDCKDEQTLVWLPVEDDSGSPVRYFVELEYQVTADQWEMAEAWELVADKQVDAEVDCGLFYRWRVRAQDSAGNHSAWSAWFHFSVSMS